MRRRETQKQRERQGEIEQDREREMHGRAEPAVILKLHSDRAFPRLVSSTLSECVHCQSLEFNLFDLNIRDLEQLNAGRGF